MNPLLNIPVPVKDFAAVQRGAVIIYQFTLPELTTEGKQAKITRMELRLDDEEGTPTLRVDHNDVVFVARLVGKSKSRRGWIGAAVGALASLPLSISMPGDMMIPAALAGAGIGRATGDSRAEVIFERRDVLPHDVKAR